MTAHPYKSTQIFNETTLPAALRSRHSTKAGVWGVIRVLTGRLTLHYAASGEAIELSAERAGIVGPLEEHWVEPHGAMTMRVEFHDSMPQIGGL